MRSFYLLSFVSSVFLLSCSPSQAQQLHELHGKSRAWQRHLKRDTTDVFTYFNDGQGACGITNGPNDFIVALNSAQWDGGTHCFEMITITVNGLSTQAQITDQCGGCSVGGLDLSQSLFEFFGSLNQGQLSGSWVYNNDIATSSSVSPTPTSYTPTSTSTSTTTITTTTTSEAPSTTITTSLTSTIASSPTSSTSTIPTSTPSSLQTIAQINLALVELGTLLQISYEL